LEQELAAIRKLAATETIMHPDKQNNILNLSPQDRYGYFIRKVADFEEVWLIQDNGQYVTLGDKEDQIAIPVWPEKEFAELMLADDWKGYNVEGKDVHEFVEWLDTLEGGGYKIAGFPGVDLKGVVVTADEMKNHLIYELQQYE
jgi:hypothetical protein